MLWSEDDHWSFILSVRLDSHSSAYHKPESSTVNYTHCFPPLCLWLSLFPFPFLSLLLISDLLSAWYFAQKLWENLPLTFSGINLIPDTWRAWEPTWVMQINRTICIPARAKSTVSFKTSFKMLCDSQATRPLCLYGQRKRPVRGISPNSKKAFKWHLYLEFVIFHQRRK